MAIIINTVDSNYFELNGKRYATIYQPLTFPDDALGIYNIYDTKQQLLSHVHYSEFTVDSVTYGSRSALIDALLPVIYKNVSATSSGSWGSITGTLSSQTDLQSELDAKSDTGHTHTTSDITNLSAYTGFDTRYYTKTQSDANFIGDAPSDGLEYVRKNSAWSVSSGSGGGGTWGSITGTLSDQTDLQSELDAKSDTGHTHTTSDITNLSAYTGFDARYYTETEVDSMLGGYLQSTDIDGFSELNAIVLDATLWSNINDGAGSGLDADTLDGVQGSSYALAADYVPRSGGVTMTGDLSVPLDAYNGSWAGNAEVPTKDAVYDKIESLSTGLGFVADTGDTMTGALTVDTSSPQLILQGQGASVNNVVNLELRNDGGTTVAKLGMPNSGDDDLYLTNSVSGQSLIIDDNGTTTSLKFNAGAPRTIWHAGNDGSGSGLDADLLDGQHASDFALSSSLSSYLPLAGGTITGTTTFLDNVQLRFGTGSDFRLYHDSAANKNRIYSSGPDWVFYDGAGAADRLTVARSSGNVTVTGQMLLYGSQNIPIISRGSSSGTSARNYWVGQDSAGTEMFYLGVSSTGNKNVVLQNSQSTSVTSIRLYDNDTLRYHIGAAVYYIAHTGASADFGSNSLTAQNFILSSDERLKDNIEDIQPREDVRWRQFEMDGNLRYGVIAQEVREIYPEFVHEGEEDGMLKVSYNDILVAENAKLRERVESLEKDIEIIKQMLKDGNRNG